MRKPKRRPIDFSDIPEITDAEARSFRRVTPEETERFRKAIEKKLGVPRPPRTGRPPKPPEEKYRPISWRMPPEVSEWLITQADKADVGGYQTFLSLFLRGMKGYEVVREGDEISMKDPKSKHVIPLAGKGRAGKRRPAKRRRDADEFDRKIEKASRSGKLDKFSDRALREHKAGKSRPL